MLLLPLQLRRRRDPGLFPLLLSLWLWHGRNPRSHLLLLLPPACLLPLLLRLLSLLLLLLPAGRTPWR